MSRYFTNVKNAIEERVNTSYIDELYTKDAQGEFRKLVAGGDDIELPTYIKEDKIEFTNGSGISADGLSYKEGSTTITKTIKEVFDAVPEYIGPGHIEFANKTGLFDDHLKVRNHITIEGGGYNWHVAEYRANEIKYSIDGLNTRYISLDSLAKADGWYSFVSHPTSTISFGHNTAFKFGDATIPGAKPITAFDGNKVEGAKIMVELTGYDFTALANNGEAVVQFDINYGGSNQYPIFKVSLMNIVFSYADVEDVNKFYIGPTYVPEDADPITGNRRCSFTIQHPPEAGLSFPPINKIYILLEFSKTMHLPTDYVANN